MASGARPRLRHRPGAKAVRYRLAGRGRHPHPTSLPGSASGSLTGDRHVWPSVVATVGRASHSVGWPGCDVDSSWRHLDLGGRERSPWRTQ